MNLKMRENDIELKINIESEKEFKKGMEQLISQIRFTKELRKDIDIHIKSMEETYHRAVHNYVTSDGDLDKFILNHNGEKIVNFVEYIPSYLNKDLIKSPIFEL